MATEETRLERARMLLALLSCSFGFLGVRQCQRKALEGALPLARHPRFAKPCP